ncbi:MAG: hypothetical protein A2942_00145 [Candidatus Lloydbacteria bacterium RIFCSPLOWO2_01_FULL_50_20]|uniref:Uncharacterized protein n=1 Tax=Candidatus Lloydbacteria bacterium RIFCSPLOWO2_01_FULL_50_20 TaxID=1798665 RepID=A0A1G2DK45_9BACT|nr:MAG: hypothetical protein A3C13_00650 [Candidatus Lloydbacteria bacterium RIFCSPHIGHO2_02_FULL_50_11]OGZ13782.1 MAG: hypothetical protein A2942_00145 [Candidatus Lloydbacteria bacterium RIFCSPLOWO2_01_FULL_50_20]
MQIIKNGCATGVIINGTVHVLKPSSSRYHLRAEGAGGQYVCQDNCCDRGLRSDVEAIVAEAAARGATKVVLRMGQREYHYPMIAGLPVKDVSNCVGDVGEGARICAAW